MENKKEWIDFLIKKAKFELTEEERTKFEKDLDVFADQLKMMDRFDLTDVRPMSTPFIEYENTLRNDDNVVNKTEKILENASNTKDGYILLKKEEK